MRGGNLKHDIYTPRNSLNVKNGGTPSFHPSHDVTVHDSPS
jgi:hypothetical protein